MEISFDPEDFNRQHFDLNNESEAGCLSMALFHLTKDIKCWDCLLSFENWMKILSVASYEARWMEVVEAEGWWTGNLTNRKKCVICALKMTNDVCELNERGELLSTFHLFSLSAAFHCSIGNRSRRETINSVLARLNLEWCIWLTKIARILCEKSN